VPVPPGRALVYVFRPSTFGPHLPIALLADGTPIGNTLAQTFYLIDAPAGSLRLLSRAENTSELALQLQAGQRYFVIQEASMGVMSAITQLELVHPQRGREGIQNSRLVRRVKL